MAGILQLEWSPALPWQHSNDQSSILFMATACNINVVMAALKRTHLTSDPIVALGHAHDA